MTGAASLGSADLLRAAARAIHGEHDRDRVVAWAADAIAATTEATVTGLCLLTQPGSPVWTVAASSARDLTALGDPRTFPEVAAALRGEPWARRSDDSLRRLLGATRLELLPVPRSDGGVHGVALLAWLPSEPSEPSEPSRPADGPEMLDLSAIGGTALALVAHLGVALDNHEAMADLEAAQRDVVHKLQEAVRPPTPAVAQTELGVYYLAADQQASTGGDLYDWVVLPDGELHLTVVDVMGKGVAATKDAVAVTHAVRLLVLDGCPLDRVIARADALVTAQNPELVATVMVGRYDPTTGRLRLVGGGHPPALLVSGGEVLEIEAGGIPIGFPGAGSEGEVAVTLERSDTVIFYTDGLIETTKDIVKGLEALIGYAKETASYPAASLARVLVDRALEGAVRHDDSLAVVLRRRSPPAAAAPPPVAPLEYRFTPSTAAVPIARHFLEDWLVRIPADPAEATDLLLVASELCANAVRHASGERGSVTFRARVVGADVVLEVEDDGGLGAPLPEPTDELPEPLAERGRGLFLVRALVDSLESEVVDGRTLIRVVRKAVVARPDTAG
ncbi:MAG TPA: SpoIIE family protein phosphatase [Acidimicrobiales bacterium]|nr:SpoIIE family protein phosphatase [Acidimicrobiales bacterium]